MVLYRCKDLILKQATQRVRTSVGIPNLEKIKGLIRGHFDCQPCDTLESLKLGPSIST